MMITSQRQILWAAFLAFLLVGAEKSAAQSTVTFTATLSKSGKEMSTAVTEAKAYQDNFPKLRREGNILTSTGCEQAAKTVCLPAQCEIDFSRTYSNVSDPRGFGKAGPGYGVVINSLISRNGYGWATHVLDKNTKCLTSTVRVCSQRTVTGATYDGYHEIYAKCPTLQPWKKTQDVGPFTLPPGAYQFLTSYDPPPGSANAVPGTVTTDGYGFTVKSKNPTDAPLIAGMFKQSPNISGANGPQFWARLSDDIDLSVRGMEVTQGIQDLANRMPLVGRRKTAVRAYVKSLVNVGGVEARLRAYQDGVTELPSSPLAPENPTQGQTTGGDRLKLTDNFLFHLPQAWTENKGFLLLRLELDPGDLIKEVDETNNSHDEYIQFEPPTALHVTSVPLHLHQHGISSNPILTYTDTHSTFWPILGNLLRFHPVSSLLYWDCGLEPQKPAGHDLFGREWDLTSGLDQALLLTRVSVVRALNACGPPDAHWVGLVHPDISTNNGNGSTLGIAVPFGRASWVKMGLDGGPSWATRTSSTISHELGHNRGLFHVNCSGNEGFPVTPLYPHPFPGCRLAKGEDGFYGFDVFRDLWNLPQPTVISNEPDAPFQNRAFPLMGYKGPSWIDPFHYCRLLWSYGIFSCNPLLMGRTFPDSNKAGVFASISGLGVATPPSLPPGPPIPFPTAPERNYLMVSGAFDASTDTFHELDVRFLEYPPANALQLEPSEADPSDQIDGDDGPELLLLQTGFGGSIHAKIVRLTTLEGLEGIRTFFTVVPAQGGVDGVVIERDGKKIAEKRASANRPWVQILKPDQGGQLLPGTQVTWASLDADGDPLTYSVHYSPDGGQTWRLLTLDLDVRSFTLPARLPGSGAALLRVTAHDGFWTASDETDTTFTVADSAPRAIILNPDGSTVPVGATVSLTGIGTDLEQGPITTPASFAWTSDRDGALGAGPEIQTRKLSRGVHRIVLTVNDDNGHTGRASILLYVGVDPLQGTWTRWFDIDGPSGVGDYEMLPNFLGQGACPQPLAIECRTTGGRDWTTTGQAYTCDKATGGYCVNRQQPFGKPCQDYEVRFLCPAS